MKDIIDNFLNFEGDFDDVSANNPNPEVESIPVRLLEDHSISEPYLIQDMPDSFSASLDHLAARFLDSDSRFTAVLGGQCSGKTFFVEQLNYNISNYIKGSKKINRMLFFVITNNDLLKITNHESFLEYYYEIISFFGCKSNEVCFFTDDVNVAFFLQNTPRADFHVILEADSDDFDSYLISAKKADSRTWSDWKVYDVESSSYSLEDIASIMRDTCVERLNKSHENTATNITESHIRSVISKVSEKFPNFIEEDKGEKRSLLPLGVWGMVFKYLFGLFKFTTNKKMFNKSGTPNMVKFMPKLITEMEQFLGSFEEDGSDDLSLEDILPSFLQEELGMGRIVVAGQGQRSEKKEEKESFSFGDMRSLHSRLKKTVIGQDAALAKISDSLIVPAAGLSIPDKPIRSFLFAGPTGVGKTQTALSLAEELGNKPMNVIRVDMSEYQQPHEVAKLFGAPPGYLGYDNGGMLTNAVKEHPNSLVLLDEIEKADPKIWDTFLQVLDAGRMTDGQGETVDFTQTIIIMTSNIGVKESQRSGSGFQLGSTYDQYLQRVNNSYSIVKKTIEQEFRPEFVNRIDDIIMFNELSPKVMESIVKLEVSKIQKLLKERKPSSVALSPVDNSVIQKIIQKADIAKYGAREIQRSVFRMVTNPVAKYIVDNPKVKKVNIRVEGEETVAEGMKA